MKIRYYSPRINRLLVCALFYEARRRGKPMTRLADELLLESLRGSESLAVARQRFGVETPQGLTNSGQREERTA